MDKRLGTYAPNGGYATWPSQYISGQPYERTPGGQPPTVVRLSAEYFCVIDPFTPPNRTELVEELRASVQPKARAVKVEAAG